MITLTRPEIEALVDIPAAAMAIREAYRAASGGRITLPPVGHITFPLYDADCHIKYGHLAGSPTFVIKVATGFPNNSATGLSTGSGLVLVLSATTGAVEAILHDEMTLTDMRTGIGGAIATKALAREDARSVLVLGTGPQAMRQIEAHAALLPQDLSFHVWGRAPDRVAHVLAQLPAGIDVHAAPDLKDAVAQADIIVTATGATAPLIQSDWVTAGSHITAVGADAPGKQELDTRLVARADVRVVDLASQCLDHGEVSHAATLGLIEPDALVELGRLLDAPALGRTNPQQITMADLTGIAAQDIAMATSVLNAWQARQ